MTRIMPSIESARALMSDEQIHVLRGCEIVFFYMVGLLAKPSHPNKLAQNVAPRPLSGATVNVKATPNANVRGGGRLWRGGACSRLLSSLPRPSRRPSQSVSLFLSPPSEVEGFRVITSAELSP